ncbi:MAG TPA: DUF4838 domain-containing protein, partial [Candidatus Binataceae bacterium]|nr:DUF4838 domain-containing protein [Candidatus Binataceae bacterium]
MAEKRNQNVRSVRILHSRTDDKSICIAIDELAGGLRAILGGHVATVGDPELDTRYIIVDFGDNTGNSAGEPVKLAGDAFEIARPSPISVAISAGSGRGLIHGVCDLMEKLGATFAPGAPAQFPRIDEAAVSRIKPYRVEPAFSRRALASDLMTWNYTFPDRLDLHLKFDREFIPWIGRRGVNAFEYIRHAHDTRLRIDEIVDESCAWGIDDEYGGHVLQILMPRTTFESNPEYFPANPDGKREPRGNLCVSNRDALKTVADGAATWLRKYPENRLLHIWGADVSGGAWCSCAQCSNLPPQIQYMTVVNAVAASEEVKVSGIPVAYLAYHDTIDPAPGLKPLANVWFEWAPRERCYTHAINDRACDTNRRYFESLERYIEIFQGRGHVFEYYADAILFGGIGFATPSVIARDLLAYKKLAINGISCLTFGAYSALSYPVNLEAFVRAARNPNFEPREATSCAAEGRHPETDAMAKAYRTIEKATAMILDYGEVMTPYKMPARKAAAKKQELGRALRQIESAVDIAQKVGARDKLAGAEAELWSFGLEIVRGIAEYLRAREERGVVFFDMDGYDSEGYNKFIP